MPIDRFINALLFVFNIGAKERRIWFHSQNLNEKRDGRTGLPHHGRCCLSTPLGQFRFEWHLWRLSLGAELDFDEEDRGLRLHVALPPVSFWLVVPVPLRLYLKSGYHGLVVFSLRVFSNALWWQFGGNHFGWSSKTPKWKNGCFHLDDFFLGKQRFTETVLSTHDVVIPMPEGPYPATVKLEQCEWKRPRWPWAIRRRTASINVPKGIPHQGKGENDYDCGEDALFGLSCEAWTLDEAISKTVASALKSRRRYDGNTMAVYPDPATRPEVRT